jgi:hypothetical protein
MRKGVERENRYFRFLKRLRAGGRSNMYGAIPYLASAFGCDRNEAFRIVCEWMDAEAAASPDAERAPQRRPAAGEHVREREPSLFDPAPAVASPSPPPKRVTPRVAPKAAPKRAGKEPVSRRVSGTSRPAAAPRSPTPRKAGKPRKPSRGKAA